MTIKNDLAKLANQKLIHLTTRGRKTGKPHTVELWFASSDGKIYLSHEGEETDWMKNIRNNNHVSFEIGKKNFTGRARSIEDHTAEAEKAKTSLYEKYYGKASKEIIEDWFSLSKLLAIDSQDSLFGFGLCPIEHPCGHKQRDGKHCPNSQHEGVAW